MEDESTSFVAFPPKLDLSKEIGHHSACPGTDRYRNVYATESNRDHSLYPRILLDRDQILMPILQH